ncbi:unnamed protein product [Rotaria sp. Silwood2]|nr:unnamed protein product [Rotaria sp. Silwood2]CAF3018142.1 unnamed protein product [Rotaria sp. Silwood2]CAF3065641.1 unnamed protein product [Rotaria sp. Silwood2]CAF3357179.1 unnamed protein product [Rotaria sp. Silwood2]CAF4421319.1 unnamed protein product [Rotaria sp. Silwood2]
MSPVLDFVKTLHLQPTWEDMTPQFNLTFCSLSMSNLQVPEVAYKRHIEELEHEMTQIDERKELIAAKQRKEKEKIYIIIDKPKEELFKQKEHVERVRAWLNIERNKIKAETISEYLQFYIFPRCLLNEIDALYCVHFIRVIHDLVTPNFSTIICYDRLFSDISYSLASCSENQAIDYRRFLESLLETIMNHRHHLFASAKCYCDGLAQKRRDMIEESQFHSVPERPPPTSTSNNSNNNAGTKMNPIVTPTIGDTNNVNHHPILSDTQPTPSSITRSK